jgi:hypothetical protein
MEHQHSQHQKQALVVHPQIHDLITSHCMPTINFRLMLQRMWDNRKLRLGMQLWCTKPFVILWCTVPVSKSLSRPSSSFKWMALKTAHAISRSSSMHSSWWSTIVPPTRTLMKNWIFCWRDSHGAKGHTWHWDDNCSWNGHGLLANQRRRGECRRISLL